MNVIKRYIISEQTIHNESILRKLQVDEINKVDDEIPTHHGKSQQECVSDFSFF